MEKQRQSNFELLRIILMIVVPLYHLMLYGQMNHLPFHKFTIASLVISSGGAIVADYAFMALTSYFFINSKKNTIFQRFIEISMQVVFIYLIKMLILRIGLGTKGLNPIFEDFFVRGAWWFINVYLVICLLYPMLNRIIYKLNIIQLRCTCVVLGLCFIYNCVTYNVKFSSDLISFLFTYFVIGYLSRTNFENFLGIHNCKKNMIIIYFLGLIITFLICLVIKWPGNIPNNEQAADLLLRFIGRYSVTQFFMGIAVFLLFRSINISSNKWINRFAGNVFYVFLLHETVMAVFWKLGKLNVIDGELPYKNGVEFLGWYLIYFFITLIFAMLIRSIYHRIVKIFVTKFAIFICNLKFVKKIEEKYLGE